MPNSNSINHVANVAYLIIILAAISYSYEIVNLILLSVVFSIIIKPIISILTEKLRLPVILSLLIVLVAIILILMLIGAIITQTINQFALNLEVITATAISKFTALYEWITPLLSKLNIHVDIKGYLNSLNISDYTGVFKSILSGVTGLMSQGFFILLTIIFIILDFDLYSKQFTRINNFNSTKTNYIRQINISITKYIEKKFVISLFTALSVYLLCIFTGFHFALMWSCLTLLFNFIPNIGVVIVSIPMILQAYILQSVTSASIFSVFLILIHFFSGNIFEPRIMSKYLNLNASIVWLSLLFWNYILGPVGMFLSIPLTATVKTLLELSSTYKKIAILMEERLPNEYNDPNSATCNIEFDS